MLITENVLNKPIIEEKDSTKLPESVLCRVTYNICNIGERNANNRVYEKSVFEKVMSDETIQEMIQNRRLFGQAEHPIETQSDLQLTSHVIHNMWMDENTNNVFQTMDVLDTPMGRIVDSLIRAGCGVGVSTRAEGDLEESEDDQGKFSRVIPESYRYVTTDFTADPSTFNVLPQEVRKNVASSVRKEMENKNASASERKFATQLFESISKVDEKEETSPLKNLLKEGKIKENTKVNYLDDSFIVKFINETAGTITISPDIEGRDVSVEQQEVVVSGSPIITVEQDGTVNIVPVPSVEFEEPAPEPVMGDEPPVEDELEPESEELEPEMEAKEDESCGKPHDYKKKKKMKEGMDQMVARKEELEVKKEAGKLSPEEQEELDELKDKLDDMEVDEKKTNEMTLPAEGGVSGKVQSGNVLKDPEENTYVVVSAGPEGLKLEPTGGGVGATPPISWEEASEKGLVKIGESKEEKEWSELDEGKLKEVSLNEPAGFQSCVDRGGRVRRVSGEKEHGLESTEYVNYCFIDGKSYRGEVHKADEAKINETVQELIGEVPGINRHDQEILNWAIDNEVIPNEWPSEEDIIDRLSQADTADDIGALEQDPAVYLKYVLLPKAKEEYAKQEAPIESKDLRIKEAITRAEKEKALETIQELSTKLESLTSETSEGKMKFRMLMKKMKEATSVYDEISALRKKLEEKAKSVSESTKALEEGKSKLEKEIKERKKLSESSNKKVKSLKESNEKNLSSIKKDYEKKLEENKNIGISEGISRILDEYITRRLAELGLRIGTNTRALLDSCESISDVEDILEKTKDMQRRNALHSEPIKEVRIDRNQQDDPEQVRINKEVGSVFEGMG